MGDDMSWAKRPRSMESLLPPNYESDGGRFELGLPRIRPAWLMDESIKSLDSKFPMVPAPDGTIELYTTPLGEKLWKNPPNKEFDLTNPLRPSFSYNYLHDQHLKYYFGSEDIRKRLQDEGFITEHGYVKCTVKEFNEYRQWVRNLKLRELYRERRFDRKLEEKAKKQRLEAIALERDVELQEIMRKRREKRKADLEVNKRMVDKEKKQQQRLSQIDNLRRKQIRKEKMKDKEFVQKKRELERIKRRESKNEMERKEQKLKLRITTKLDNEKSDRLKKLEEKKKNMMKEKTNMIEQQWYRRRSWSYEYHEQQKRARDMHEKEFNEHVMERNEKVSQQRRCSQACYQQIASANRNAFESKLQDAEVFMAKLNEKRSRELEKWKRHFEDMKRSSVSSTPTRTGSARKKRGHRRRSTWDLESCLLKDLGMSEEEIAENTYSKLGIIARGALKADEQEIMDKLEPLGTLGKIEEHVDEGKGDKDEDQDQSLEERQFSIPMIVESLTSSHAPSVSSQSDASRPSSRASGEYEEQQIKFSPSRTKASAHNLGMSQDHLRHVISKYVENIVLHSSQVLGVKVKLPDRIKLADTSSHLEAYGGALRAPLDNVELHRQVAEYVENIVKKSSEIAGITVKLPDRSKPTVRAKILPKQRKVRKKPKLEITKPTISTRVQVKHLLSNILDKAEQQAGVVIKRPPEYEQIKQELHDAKKDGTPIEKRVDSTPSYKDPRILARQLVTNIVQSAAKEMGVNVKFPPEYQSFVKRETECETVCVVSTTNIRNPILIGRRLLKAEVKLDKELSEQLREENLTRVASQLVLETLNKAISVVRAQKRNQDFFMNSQLPTVAPRRDSKEVTAHLKKKKCEELNKEEEDVVKEPLVPREVDILGNIKDTSTSKMPAVSTFYQKRSEGDKKRVKPSREAGKGLGKKVLVSNRSPGSKAGENVAKKTGEKSRDIGSESKSSKELDKTTEEDLRGESKGGKSSQGTGNELQGVVGKKVTVKEPGKGKELVKIGQKPGESLPGKNIKESYGTKSPLVGGQKDIVTRPILKRPGDKVPSNAAKEPGNKLPSDDVIETGSKDTSDPAKKPGNQIPSNTMEETGDKILNNGTKMTEAKVMSDIGEEHGKKVLTNAAKEPGNKVQSDAAKGTGSKRSGDATKEAEMKATTNATKEPENKVLSDAGKETGIKSDPSKEPGKKDVKNVAKEPGDKTSNSASKEAGKKLSSNSSKEPGNKVSSVSAKVPGDKIVADVPAKPGDKGPSDVNKKSEEKADDKTKKPDAKKVEEVKKPEDKVSSDSADETGENIASDTPEETGTDASKETGAKTLNKADNETGAKTKDQEVKLGKKAKKTKKEPGARLTGGDVKEKAQNVMGPGTEEMKGSIDVKEKAAKKASPVIEKKSSEKKRRKEKRISSVTDDFFDVNTGDNLDKSGPSELDIKSPSLPQISPTPENSSFGLKSTARPGAITPSRETTTSQERLAAGSQSSVILRMITMREQQEQSELSPQSSYVVLPQLSSSESAFISGKMENLQKDYGHNSGGVESPTRDISSQERISVTSPLPSKEADSHGSVKLPHVSSTDVSQLAQRSPTPPRCTSKSSIVSLPHIGTSNTSLVGLTEVTATASTTNAEQKTAKQRSSTRITVSPPNKHSAQKTKPPAKDQAKKSKDQAKKPEDQAKKFEGQAKKSEDQAKKCEDQAKKSEDQAKKPEDQAKKAEDQAKKSEDQATKSVDQAKKSEDQAKKSEDQAKKSEDQAKKSEDQAKKSEDQAKKSEDQAKKSENQAKKSKDQAKKFEDQAKKSENQAKKSKNNSGKGVEVTTKQQPSTGSNRRGSKSHSTTVVSKRRPSVKPSQETVFKTESSHTRTRRTSVSKSLGAAVVPGRKASVGGESRAAKHQEKSSKTDIRRTSIAKTTKTASTHSVGKGRRHSKTTTLKSQDSANIEGKQKETLSETVEGISQSSGTSGEKEQVLSATSNKKEPLTNTENKFLPADDRANRPDINTSTSEANKSSADGKATDDVNCETDSGKVREGNKKKNQRDVGKATSKIDSTKSNESLDKNVSQNVSEKDGGILKQSSGTRVGGHESKTRVKFKTPITDSRKPSEKNVMRRRSSTVTKSKKSKSLVSTQSRKGGIISESQKKLDKVPGTEAPSESSSGTHAQNKDNATSETRHVDDVTTTDAPDKADSDTEVVVKVYVPDSGDQPEGSDVMSAEKSEVGNKDEGSDVKTGDTATRDVTIVDDKQTAKEAGKDDLLVVGNAAKKAKSREELLKKSSSRKAFGDNPKMNIIPRNSLDILKVTQISRTQLGQGTQDRNLSANVIGKTLQQSPSKTTPSRTMGQKPQGSRSHWRPGVTEEKAGNTATKLGLMGVSLSVKSSNTQQQPMQRVSSKVFSNLEKVEENPNLELFDEGMQPRTAEGSDNETARDVKSKASPPIEPRKSDHQKEVISKESSESISRSSIPRNVSLNSSSFSGIIQGTPLLSKDSGGKDTSPKNTSPQSLRYVPSPPTSSKPGVVSPKVSRVKQSISKGSSGRSRASLGSNPEMSPTASLEIVKLSSQGSHGWVSSPTSSVKFLPPIEMRASKTSNTSDDSQKRRPRTAESGASPAGSGGSQEPTVIEIRRSSSGALRVDGKNSGAIAVKSSSSGGSAKQTVIGF